MLDVKIGDALAVLKTLPDASVQCCVTSPPYYGLRDAHFATMPVALAEKCVLAGSRPGDTVLDPFGGAGTAGLAALLIELNPAYAHMAGLRVLTEA